MIVSVEELGAGFAAARGLAGLYPLGMAMGLDLFFDRHDSENVY
jgi:hypothetical protein